MLSIDPSLSFFLFLFGGPCRLIYIYLFVCLFIHLFVCIYFYLHTSSTVQGVGGSFKDRKLLGKVSCCDTWMAERTDGPKMVKALSYLPRNLCVYLPTIYLFDHLAI